MMNNYRNSQESLNPLNPIGPLNSLNLVDRLSPLNSVKFNKGCSSYGVLNKMFPTPYGYYRPAGDPQGSPSLIKGSKYPANPYGMGADSPNCLLLTPAIFGTAAAFIIGFRYFGHSNSNGYPKYIFFVTSYGIIASLGAAYYIYQLFPLKDHDTQLSNVVFPLLMVTFLFASIFNLTYSLYPFTFSGTIGHTKITQFLSFLALSIGSISVGESFNVTAETTGIQILAATESFWNLFSLSLLISLLV